MQAKKFEADKWKFLLCINNLNFHLWIHSKSTRTLFSLVWRMLCRSLNSFIVEIPFGGHASCLTQLGCRARNSTRSYFGLDQIHIFEFLAIVAFKSGKYCKIFYCYNDMFCNPHRLMSLLLNFFYHSLYYLFFFFLRIFNFHYFLFSSSFLRFSPSHTPSSKTSF